MRRISSIMSFGLYKMQPIINKRLMSQNKMFPKLFLSF